MVSEVPFSLDTIGHDITDTTEMKNVNTKRKTESDIRIFKDWLSTVREHRNPEYIGVEEMYMHMARFFSVCTKFKQYYEPNSLKCIQASISRYLSFVLTFFISVVSVFCMMFAYVSQ
jgi:hypothetical protein